MAGAPRAVGDVIIRPRSRVFVCPNVRGTAFSEIMFLQEIERLKHSRYLLGVSGLMAVVTTKLMVFRSQ
jgi:hypothetical protein